MKHRHDTIDAILSEMIANGNVVRIQSRDIDGEKFWFKDYSIQDRTLYQLGHQIVSVLLWRPFFRAAPPLTPSEAKRREIQKFADMKAAGISTPHIVATRENIVVMRDAGITLENDLRQIRKHGNGVGHDQKLVEWMQQIANVHAAGFTLGRPHPRDTILNNNEWVFLDFEEHPEEVMSLETAQARDLLLAIVILSKKMLDPSNLSQAMEAYRTSAPQIIVEALRENLQRMKPVFSIASLLMKIRAGKDLERFVLATKFLKENLEIK